MRDIMILDWIDPTRIYNIRVPAARFPFIWGLVIYPLIVIFVLFTTILVVLESAYPTASISDYLGIIMYCLMLGWVGAAVSSCYRRLRYLGMSQGWVWLIIIPVVNLIFSLYLLLKSAPSAHREAG